MSQNLSPVTLSYPYLCGLCGKNPTTLSQAMHNAAFRSFDLPYLYTTFAVSDLPFMIQATRQLGLRGLSVTIPHKEDVLPLVDLLSDEVRAIGSANTVVNDNGVLSAFNTDFIGVTNALTDVGFSLANARVLILGAGGAARAAMYSCLVAGSTSVSVLNRNEERAKSLVEYFREKGFLGGIFHGEFSWIKAQKLTTEILHGFDLIINATPVGSKRRGENHPPSSPDEYLIPIEALAKEQLVFEMVTNETELTVTAKARGCKVVLGIEMLVHQAAKQFELFTGLNLSKHNPLQTMRTALLTEVEKGNSQAPGR